MASLRQARGSAVVAEESGWLNLAYSEELADRIREGIEARPGVTERKMFGGIAWMVNGNMARGIVGEDLMVRLDREDAETALSEEHVGPMECTGRPMRGSS